MEEQVRDQLVTTAAECCVPYLEAFREANINEYMEFEARRQAIVAGAGRAALVNLSGTHEMAIHLTENAARELQEHRASHPRLQKKSGWLARLRG